MQTQKIVLLPPTHEQSLPSFHLQEGCLGEFLPYLETRGFHVVEPPADLGCLGPGGTRLMEVKVEAGTPVDRLETTMREFLHEEEAA